MVKATFAELGVWAIVAVAYLVIFMRGKQHIKEIEQNKRSKR